MLQLGRVTEKGAIKPLSLKGTVNAHTVVLEKRKKSMVGKVRLQQENIPDLRQGKKAAQKRKEGSQTTSSA